jgi:hypothetical protein
MTSWCLSCILMRNALVCYRLHVPAVQAAMQLLCSSYCQREVMQTERQGAQFCGCLAAQHELVLGVVATVWVHRALRCTYACATTLLTPEYYSVWHTSWHFIWYRPPLLHSMSVALLSALRMHATVARTWG